MTKYTVEYYQLNEQTKQGGWLIKTVSVTASSADDAIEKIRQIDRLFDKVISVN